MALVKVINSDKPPVKIADSVAKEWVVRFPNEYEIVEPVKVIKSLSSQIEVTKVEPLKKKEGVAEKSGKLKINLSRKLKDK